MGQRQRQLELALLAVRQLLDDAIAASGEPADFQCLRDAGCLLLIELGAAEERELASAQSAHGDGEIFLDAERRKQVGDLKGAGDTATGAAMRRIPGDVDTFEEYAAGPGEQNPGDGVEQRSLAGAVRADD